MFVEKSFEVINVVISNLIFKAGDYFRSCFFNNSYNATCVHVKQVCRKVFQVIAINISILHIKLLW